MRKSGTHSARAREKKSAEKRGRRKKDARIPLIAFCTLGAGVLAATYGVTHQRTPEANAKLETSVIAAPQGAKVIPVTNGGDAPIQEQALRKEDRLVTGSIPKHPEIAPPPDLKAKPEAAKKKKSTVAKAQSPTSFADDIKPEAHPSR